MIRMDYLEPDKQTIAEIFRRMDAGEAFYYTRFGDGDFLNMLDPNCTRQKRSKGSPELQQALLKSYCIDDPAYMIGSILGPRKVFGVDKTEEIRAYADPIFKHFTLYSAIAPHTLFQNYGKGEDFMDLHKRLLNKRVLLLCAVNADCQLNRRIFNVTSLKTLPQEQGFYAITDKWYNRVKELALQADIVVSCVGSSTKAIAGRLWYDGVRNIQYLDLGSVTDAMARLGTRKWIRQDVGAADFYAKALKVQ